MREFARVWSPAASAPASVPDNPWRYDWSHHWVGHRGRCTAARLAERFTAAVFADVDVTDYGFPLLGLDHRQVYRRTLEAAAGARWQRRRLAHLRDEARRPARARGVRALHAVHGRPPGHFGLIASARPPA